MPVHAQKRSPRQRGARGDGVREPTPGRLSASAGSNRIGFGVGRANRSQSTATGVAARFVIPVSSRKAADECAEYVE
jgi:hypothetical protein